MCVCVSKAILSPLSLSDDEEDLSAVTPLLVASYVLCYTPFVVSEVTTALTHGETCQELLHVVKPQTEHFSTHSSLFLSIDQSADPVGKTGPVSGTRLVKDMVIGDVLPGLWSEPSDLLLPPGLQGGGPGPVVDQ